MVKDYLIERDTEWHRETDKPEKNVYVIVMDNNKKEYPNHTWNGISWYDWVIDDYGADGWRSDVDNICYWRYQYLI